MSDEFDLALMMGRPVVMNEFEKRVAAEQDIDLSAPYDNSVQENCGTCNRAVWLGPLQQHQRREMQGTTVLVVCPTCAAKYATSLDEDDTVEVVSLGNRHPQE